MSAIDWEFWRDFTLLVGGSALYWVGFWRGWVTRSRAEAPLQGPPSHA